MAESIWIKVDGCKGEATDSKHTDEIDVDTWHWGLAAPIDPAGTGLSAGETTASALTVSKTFDMASPNLILFCASQKPLGKVVLTQRKRGDSPIENVKITMENAVVASVQDSGSGDGVPVTESVSFAFTGVSIEYTPQKDDGTAGAAVTAGWDFAKNQKK